MKATGLFSALRKYRVRDNSDPLENYLTEAFAWLLKADAEFSIFFLNSLMCKHSDPIEASQGIHWFTQCNFGGVYPDMVCEIAGGEFAYVFEHKVWSGLHPNQLQNYRRRSAERYGQGNYRIILITAHRSQHAREASEALCWEDVYIRVERYLQTKAGTASGIHFLLKDFLKLLQDIGLSPHGSFTIEELIGYSASFYDRMKLLWTAFGNAYSKPFETAVLARHPQCNDAKLHSPFEHHGLVGIKLFDEMRPNLFVGALLDPRHYHVERSDALKGPDCCIILTFDEPFHHLYGESEFRRLLESIQAAFADEPDGWTFHSHIDATESELKNTWHPIHIRKPLVEVLALGQTDSSLQTQAHALQSAIDKPLSILFRQTTLLAFRESFARSYAPQTHEHTI